MLDDADQAELAALRARVYGRPGDADPTTVARLAQLENGSDATTAVAAESFERDLLVVGSAAAQVPPAPVVVVSHPPAIERGRRRVVVQVVGALLIAGLGVAAGYTLGVAQAGEQDADRGQASRPSAVGAVPDEFVESLDRVSTWWDWDESMPRLGTTVEGSPVWVGGVADGTRVCLVLDEQGTYASGCNPAGQYPSVFTLTKTSEPAAGVYTFTVEQTGQVEFTRAAP